MTTPLSYKDSIGLGPSTQHPWADPQYRGGTLPSMMSQIPAPTPAQTVVQQVVKYGRRPLIQIVVIYASNHRVMGYAQRVSEEFLESGIDVVLQTTPTGEPKSKGRVHDIMTEHMAEIIVNSHADFLVVIGDRNMKNRSVHSKRKGKLLEMKVSDMQLLIWKSWPQNPHKNWTRIEALTDEQLEDLIDQYSGLKSISERVYALQEAADSIATKGPRNAESAITLEGFDKLSVRLHRQIWKTYVAIGNLVQAPSSLEGTKGALQPRSYKPNAPKTPWNTISPLVQHRLLIYLMKQMKEIEDNCDLIGSAFLPSWAAYHKEEHLSWVPIQVPLPPPPPPEEEGARILPSYRSDGELPTSPPEQRRRGGANVSISCGPPPSPTPSHSSTPPRYLSTSTPLPSSELVRAYPFRSQHGFHADDHPSPPPPPPGFEECVKYQRDYGSTSKRFFEEEKMNELKEEEEELAPQVSWSTFFANASYSSSNSSSSSSSPRMAYNSSSSSPRLSSTPPVSSSPIFPSRLTVSSPSPSVPSTSTSTSTPPSTTTSAPPTVTWRSLDPRSSPFLVSRPPSRLPNETSLETGDLERKLLQIAHPLHSAPLPPSSSSPLPPPIHSAPPLGVPLPTRHYAAHELPPAPMPRSTRPPTERTTSLPSPPNRPLNLQTAGRPPSPTSTAASPDHSSTSKFAPPSVDSTLFHPLSSFTFEQLSSPAPPPTKATPLAPLFPPTSSMPSAPWDYSSSQFRTIESIWKLPMLDFMSEEEYQH